MIWPAPEQGCEHSGLATLFREKKSQAKKMKMLIPQKQKTNQFRMNQMIQKKNPMKPMNPKNRKRKKNQNLLNLN